MQASPVVRRLVLSAVLATLAGCTASPAVTLTPTQSPERSGVPTVAASPSAPATQAPASATAILPAPPSGRIAFVKREIIENTSVADVYLVNADGSAPTQLTDDARFEGGLVWAPDGSRLYYESERISICGDSYCFASRLYSVAPDGSDRRDHGPIGSGGPGSYTTKGVPSPNHRFVGYGGEGGNDSIPALIVDLEQGSAGRLAGVATDVRWSPDSAWILVLGFEHWVEVIDATTGETLLHIDDPGLDSLVGWTPDGGSIVYRRCKPGAPKNEVIECLNGPPWRVNVDDPSVPAGRYVGPALPRFGASSPDGLWIANVEPDGLYVAPSDGSDAQLLFAAANGADFEEYPTWSPDGEWIAFRGPDAIHLVPRAGGEGLMLPRGYSPAWQPER